MELTKCSLCSMSSHKKLSSEGEIKLEEVLVQNNFYGDDQIINQLKIIFLLRKILEIPQEKCCEFLVDYGDPCSWINCCPSCSDLIEKGKIIFNQMNLLQNQFKDLQNKIKRTIIMSVCETDTEDDECKWGVQETLKSFISQGPSDVITAARNEETTERNFCLGVNYEQVNSFPRPCSLNSDTHNQWTEVEDSSFDISNKMGGNGTFDEQDTLGEKENPNVKHFVNISDVKKETEESCYLIENKQIKSKHDQDWVTKRKVSVDLSSVRVNPGTKDKKHKCTFCGKGFLRNWELVRHERIHAPRLCDKSFADSSKLRGLKRFRTGANPYKCKHCGKRYARPNELKIHERNHNGEKLYQCAYCEKSFSKNSQLNGHERIHTGEKPYGCRVCKKRFTLSSNLKHHERIHTKPYRCTLCEKRFARKISLSRHETVHRGEKPYGCRFCEEMFQSRKALKLHELIHTGEGSHQCTFCEKTFALDSDLKLHERIHTGERPFGCGFCEKRFTRVGTLKRHERTHTDGKCYHCSFCEKSFSQNTELKNHERIHTGEKPFECRNCGKRFSQASNLKTHEKTHNEKITM